MLNGIDLDMLRQASDEIRDDPDKGMVTYGVNLSWAKGVRAEATSKPLSIAGQEIDRTTFSWVVDEPEQLLGAADGPTPQEYLMSGVGACIMVGFVVNAAAKGVEVRTLDVELRGSLDLAGFMNIRDDAEVKMLGLDYTIRVDADASDELIAEIEATAVDFSPNAMTVRNGVPLSGKLVRV